MMLYKLALALMIFGGVSAAIQDAGFYPTVSVPQTSAVGIREADVQSLSDTVGDSTINSLWSISTLQTILHIILSAFLAVVTIIPILTSYGCPLILAVALQAPIWIVMGWGIYQMATGHNSRGMD